MVKLLIDSTTSLVQPLKFGNGISYFISHLMCIWLLIHAVIFQRQSMLVKGSPVLHVVVIKWKHFPRYWPFVWVWRLHRSPVISPHKGQWRGALMFSLICSWIIGWVNNGAAGDLRRHRTHYDVIVMFLLHLIDVGIVPSHPPALTGKV